MAESKTIRDHGRAEVDVSCRAIRPVEQPLRVRLHDHDHQHRQRRRAARQPPLDHHRRRAQVQEVRGLGVVGEQPVLKPGESFEYTSGTSLATPVGTMRGTYQMVAEDGTRSSDDPGVHAVGAARAALSAARPAAARHRALAASRRRALRLRAHRPPRRCRPPARSATSDSNSNHPIASSLRIRCVACDAPLARASLALGAAASPRRPRCPPPATAAPAGAPRRPLPAILPRSPGARCPAGARIAREAAWPAFRAGCAALVASPTTQAALAGHVRRRRDRRRAATPLAVRAFFERHFTPYQVRGRRRRGHRLVTGYYEPLLRGSAHASRALPVPLYAPPDDLLVVELADLYPELKGKRLRGRVEGRRVVPYWPRADIDARQARTRRQGARLRRRPGRRVLPADPGLGPGALADGGVMRVGYADQNGQPYRSSARVLIDRGEMTLERASMQGIRAWGRQQSREAAATARRESELRLLSRSAAARCRARSKRRSTVRSARSACRCRAGARSRSIPARSRSARRSFLATTYPLSTTPLQRLVLAQDTGGAIRGAVRADFFWGFGDEPDARRAGCASRDRCGCCGRRSDSRRPQASPLNVLAAPTRDYASARTSSACRSA